MKKQLVLPLATLIFAGCQLDSVTEPVTLSEELSNEISQTSDGENLRQLPKINICHDGEIISINQNALKAHQSHGDAIDMDGDGYMDKENVCTATDCDDENPLINPNAEEVCGDGIDNDCDGEIDEGCQQNLTLRQLNYNNDFGFLDVIEQSFKTPRFGNGPLAPNTPVILQTLEIKVSAIDLEQGEALQIIFYNSLSGSRYYQQFVLNSSDATTVTESYGIATLRFENINQPLAHDQTHFISIESEVDLRTYGSTDSDSYSDGEIDGRYSSSRTYITGDIYFIMEFSN